MHWAPRSRTAPASHWVALAALLAVGCNDDDEGRVEPEISDLSPSTVTAGETITIEGRGFGANPGRVDLRVAATAPDDDRSATSSGPVSPCEVEVWTPGFVTCQVFANTPKGEGTLTLSTDAGLVARARVTVR